MHLNLLNLITISASIFVFIWLLILQVKFVLLKKRLKLFFKGSRAQDLEGVLAEQFKRWRFCQQGLQGLETASRLVHKVSQASIHKVGLVRFNPFSKVGSDQSFSIALLDGSQNGLVISSLYTNEGCRIYAKPITKASSRYPLSEEEKEAINQALKT